MRNLPAVLAALFLTLGPAIQAQSWAASLAGGQAAVCGLGGAGQALMAKIRQVAPASLQQALGVAQAGQTQDCGLCLLGAALAPNTSGLVQRPLSASAVISKLQDQEAARLFWMAVRARAPPSFRV